MRIAVVTLFTPEIAEMGEFTAANKAAYCAKQGYDLFVHRNSLDPWRPPSWSKVPALLEVLPRYDWIFWTDADAMVLNHDVRLESFLDEQAELIISRDRWGVNMGQFFLRCTKTAED